MGQVLLPDNSLHLHERSKQTCPHTVLSGFHGTTTEGFHADQHTVGTNLPDQM